MLWQSSFAGVCPLCTRHENRSTDAQICTGARVHTHTHTHTYTHTHIHAHTHTHKTHTHSSPSHTNIRTRQSTWIRCNPRACRERNRRKCCGRCARSDACRCERVRVCVLRVIHYVTNNSAPKSRAHTHKHAHARAHTHTHTLSLSLFHTHIYTHSLTQSLTHGLHAATGERIYAGMQGEDQEARWFVESVCRDFPRLHRMSQLDEVFLLLAHFRSLSLALPPNLSLVALNLPRPLSLGRALSLLLL